MLNENEKSNKSEDLIALLGEENFETEVLRCREPVLVAFWAPWSRPCQVLDPILQELAVALAGKAKVVKVNADDSVDLSLCYEIQSIPTLLYFVEGNSRLRIIGTATKEAILAKLKHFDAVNENGEGRQPGKEN
jgi:thioredoxin 1